VSRIATGCPANQKNQCAAFHAETIYWAACRKLRPAALAHKIVSGGPKSFGMFQNRFLPFLSFKSLNVNHGHKQNPAWWTNQNDRKCNGRGETGVQQKGGR